MTLGNANVSSMRQEAQRDFRGEPRGDPSWEDAFEEPVFRKAKARFYR